MRRRGSLTGRKERQKRRDSRTSHSGESSGHLFLQFLLTSLFSITDLSPWRLFNSKSFIWQKYAWSSAFHIDKSVSLSQWTTFFPPSRPFRQVYQLFYLTVFLALLNSPTDFASPACDTSSKLRTRTGKRILTSPDADLATSGCLDFSVQFFRFF